MPDTKDDDFLAFASRADLERLVAEQFEETLFLEYKASKALGRTSDQINELCKDVSAFANSAGGQIIYGIEEDRIGRRPKSVDSGVEDGKVTREWIEQIIASNIQPRIHGVRITRIDLGNGRFGYVLTIPSTKRGPHQAPDKKYYRRFDLRSVPMEDYEIRDVMSRHSSPDLEVTFHFDNMASFYDLRFRAQQEDHDKVGMTPLIRNYSEEPALYAMVVIGVDSRLLVSSQTYERAGEMRLDAFRLNAFRLRFNAAQNMPIFKEAPTMLPNFGIVVPDSIIFHREPYLIAYEVRSPGCHKEGRAYLFVEDGNRLRLSDGP